jgi:hypothetical protein
MHTEEGTWGNSSLSLSYLDSRSVWWTLEFDTNVVLLEITVSWYFRIFCTDNNSTKGHRTLSNPFGLRLSSFDINLCSPVCYHSFINGSTALCWALVLPEFRYLFYTVGRTPWTGDQTVARPLPTHRTTHTQNVRTQTSLLWVGIEPTIPAFELAKTVHALDSAATLIGSPVCIYY